MLSMIRDTLVHILQSMSVPRQVELTVQVHPQVLVGLHHLHVDPRQWQLDLRTLMTISLVFLGVPSGWCWRGGVGVFVRQSRPGHHVEHNIE